MSINASASTGAASIYQHRWWTLAVVSLAWGVAGVGTSIMNVSLPTLQRELNASSSDLQWIMNAYILAVAALLITMGSVGDRVGSAHALRGGVIAIAAGSILAMTANSANIVIVARVIMGIGAAAIMPATLAVITHAFPVEERGKAVAIWTVIVSVSIALGPIIGGLLIRYFSWHSIFFFNVPFAIAVLAGSLFFLPNHRNQNARHVDIPGMLLSTAGLATLVYGLIRAGMGGWTDGTVIGCFGVATALIFLFVLWELHAATPMLDPKLFANPRLSAGTASILLVTLVYSGTLFVLTLYMQFVRGHSALETGILFLPFGIGCVAGSVTSYRRVERFGIKWTIASALLLLAGILAVTSFWTGGTPYWMAALTMFVVAFCMNTVIPPATTASVSSVPASRSGEVSGISPLSMQVGSAMGIALMGSILASQYTSSVAHALAGKVTLSVDTMASIQKSLGSAIAVADKLPSGTGEIVRTAARNSFMDGWQVMALVICVIAVAGAIFAVKFMPPRLSPVLDTSKTRAPGEKPLSEVSSAGD